MKTLIYYTANRERESFEKQIVDGILEAKGDLPVISVSQKPMDFGENICVGDKGHSYLNAFRQILIGCEAAKTPFVIMAESDCLYPPGYFDFTPDDTETIYSYDNAWVLWTKYGKYFKKEQTHGSIIYGREFLIKMLKTALKGLPEWSTKRQKFQLFRPEYRQQEFTGLPLICVKTDDAPNKGVSLSGLKAQTLEHWGDARELKSRLCR